jgi:hypothetical protein
LGDNTRGGALKAVQQSNWRGLWVWRLGGGGDEFMGSELIVLVVKLLKEREINDVRTNPLFIV